MTDTEKAALCARIDELCAENEKLRQEQDAVKCATCEAMLDCDECLRADASQKERKGLAYENAKLRELADSSYTFAFNCYHGVFDQEVFFRLREKYRDSGIEVPL